MITHDRWIAAPVHWDDKKLQGVWGLLQHYPTLFSDLTRGSFENFEANMRDPATLVIEVRDGDVPVGYFKFTDLNQEIDCNGHVVFFDRKPMEKAELCRRVLRWMFDSFPLHRITAEVPDLYTHTLRLAAKIGFKQEGIRRQAVCIGGRWRDLILFGILKEESYGRS